MRENAKTPGENISKIPGWVFAAPGGGSDMPWKTDPGGDIYGMYAPKVATPVRGLGLFVFF